MCLRFRSVMLRQEGQDVKCSINVPVCMVLNHKLILESILRKKKRSFDDVC